MKNEITIRSSAAEYLTFVASTGDCDESIEMRYEDENIWLTQKMMPRFCNSSMMRTVVRNSVQPGSGWRWNSRRSSMGSFISSPPFFLFSIAPAAISEK